MDGLVFDGIFCEEFIGDVTVPFNCVSAHGLDNDGEPETAFYVRVLTKGVELTYNDIIFIFVSSCVHIEHKNYVCVCLTLFLGEADEVGSYLAGEEGPCRCHILLILDADGDLPGFDDGLCVGLNGLVFLDIENLYILMAYKEVVRLIDDGAFLNLGESCCPGVFIGATLSGRAALSDGIEDAGLHSVGYLVGVSLYGVVVAVIAEEGCLSIEVVADELILARRK